MVHDIKILDFDSNSEMFCNFSREIKVTSFSDPFQSFQWNAIL